MLTAGGLQVWTTRTHDCNNGCICTEVVEDRYGTTQVLVNTECPVPDHSQEVTSVSFAPDGKRVVSGSNDTLVKIWDAATGDEVHNPTRGFGRFVRMLPKVWH